jgi:hypothetical protein
MLASACTTAQGKQFDRDNSLIVYSGFGYISEDAQPDLSGLLFSHDPRFAQPGDELLEIGAAAVSKEFPPARLQRWSDYPVVTSPQELDQVLARKLGRPAAPEDRNRLFDIFDHVYALMFVGGLEYDAGQRASFGDAALEVGRMTVSSPMQHQYAITSVASVLFDLERNEIVASATDIGFEHAVGTDAELSQTSRIARMAKSYASGARGSAELLAKLLQKLDPKEDARKAGFERYSVTDAWILQDASAPVKLFGWKPAERPAQPICQRSPQCAEAGGDCEKLIGLMIHGMTAALSRAGFLTEPALYWSDWRGGAAYNTKVTLSMGRVREPPLALRALELPQQANAADVKVMPVLTGADAFSRTAKDGVFEYRAWTATLRYRLVRTDPEDCAQTVSVTQRPDPSQPGGVGTGPVDIGPIERAAPPPAMDRLQILLAVESALDGDIRKDLDKGLKKGLH